MMTRNQTNIGVHRCAATVVAGGGGYALASSPPLWSLRTSGRRRYRPSPAQQQVAHLPGPGQLVEPEPHLQTAVDRAPVQMHRQFGIDYFKKKSALGADDLPPTDTVHTYRSHDFTISYGTEGVGVL
jgi:hypothetical protein